MNVPFQVLHAYEHTVLHSKFCMCMYMCIECVHLVIAIHVCTDARSLIQWLLEFRAQDRPNLDQILKHPWLKNTSKPHSNKTMTTSSHHHKTHITSSTHNTVSPSTNKHPLSSSTIVPKGSPCSPYRSCDGGGSPIATNTSYFTPPQGKSGVVYLTLVHQSNLVLIMEFQLYYHRYCHLTTNTHKAFQHHHQNIHETMDMFVTVKQAPSLILFYDVLCHQLPDSPHPAV